MNETSSRNPARTIVVVGAGIVGTSTARYLQRDGARVIVIDPLAPGRGTSFGNAGGMAVTEVAPLSLPGTLWRVPRWLMDPLGPLTIRWSYLPRLAPWLWRFWRASAPARVEATAKALASLLARAYDDYEPLLVEAGIRNLLKRQAAHLEPTQLIQFAGLVIDRSRHRVTYKDKPLGLTLTEFKLVTILAERKGRVQSREQLLKDVWGYNTFIDTRTVDTHMRRLRDKLGDAAKLLDTVRGVGYRFLEQ